MNYLVRQLFFRSSTEFSRSLKIIQQIVSSVKENFVRISFFGHRKQKWNQCPSLQTIFNERITWKRHIFHQERRVIYSTIFLIRGKWHIRIFSMFMKAISYDNEDSPDTIMAFSLCALRANNMKAIFSSLKGQGHNSWPQ